MVIAQFQANSMAERLGVEEGMVIASVQGVDVTEMSYTDACAFLKKEICALPQRAPLLNFSGREMAD